MFDNIILIFKLLRINITILGVKTIRKGSNIKG
jgi:hypothetical protein